MMKLTRPLAAVAAVAALSLPGLAVAYDVASLASPGGMQIEAWIEDDNRLVIGLTPSDGNKLNGMLGVAISTPTPGDWSQDLPLLVTEDGEYFTAPFSETVSFDPARLDSPSTLLVEYGTCQIAAAICVFEETEVVLHPAANGSPRISLTNVAP